MIYLDSAATTLQKPPAVARSAAWAVGHLATPGRGGHPPAANAAGLSFRCRELAARLFGVADPERVIFTFNATHALNIAIRSLVPPGGRVLLSGWEHNAVTRPLADLDVKVRMASGPLFRPETALAAFEASIEPGISAVICTHVSNVFGFILPLEGIAALCRRRGVPLIVDASQSAGCLPLDLDGLGASFIAMPGHKGLYGPQGTGLLLCGKDVETTPILCGGTGSASSLPHMPPFLPDRLEAGTHNMPGIAGLMAGLRFVQNTGISRILAHEQRLTRQAAMGLSRIPGVTVFAGPAQAGVLSFQVNGVDCETVADRLGKMGIAVRAGLHCAPLAHETAGTLQDGTVRASFSAFNTPAEGAQLVRCVARIAAHR